MNYHTPYRLYWKYFVKYSLSSKLLFFSMLLSLILGTLLQIPVPLLFKKIIDDILPQRNFQQLFRYSVLVIFIVIVREFSNYLSRVLAQKLKNTMYFRIVDELFNDFLQLPYRIFKEHGTGYFASRIFEEPKNLEDALTESVVFTIKLVFIFLFGLVACLHISWRLTILVFSFVPLYYLLSIFVGTKVRKLGVQLEEIKARMREYTLYIIQAFKMVLTINDAFRYVTEISIRKELQKFLNSRLKYQLVSSMFSSLYSVISDSMPLLIFSFGVYEIMHGRLTIGGLIAFMQLMGYISMPLEQFSDILVEIETTVGYIQRIEELKNMKRKIPRRMVKINEVRKIELESVSVKFDEEPVFENLSFTFKKGSGYIIEGDNGSGKTTLLDVLSGFLEPDKGKVVINGEIPLEIIDKQSYRENFSVAFFPPFLLPFIDENLKLIQSKYLREIAEDEVIKGRKNLKYQDLSAGEKQKLNILIALSKSASFYMFDEPFSNLDKKSVEFFKKLILQSTIEKGKGLIIVLHGDYNIEEKYKFETLILNSEEVKNARYI